MSSEFIVGDDNWGERTAASLNRIGSRFDGRTGHWFHLIRTTSEFETHALCGARLEEWTNRALAHLAEQRQHHRPKDTPCPDCIRVRDER